MDTIKRADLEFALNVADVYNEDGETIRESYSGRGMYGAECFGLVVASEREAFKAILAMVAEDLIDIFDASRLVDDLRVDSMGMSSIVYFEGWSLSDD